MPGRSGGVPPSSRAQVPALDEEDVIEQVADGREAAAGLKRRVDSRGGSAAIQSRHFARSWSE